MAAWKRWLLASRPATLTAAFVPVSSEVRTSWQQGKFHAASAAIALLGALLIQLGTNYANDLHDFLKGTDDENRLGPTRAVQAGLISIEAMRRAMVITFVGLLDLGSCWSGVPAGRSPYSVSFRSCRGGGLHRWTISPRLSRAGRPVCLSFLRFRRRCGNLLCPMPRGALGRLVLFHSGWRQLYRHHRGEQSAGSARR